MKVKNIKLKKNKLLKLYLIQNKIYIKNLKNFVLNNNIIFNLEHIEQYFKKALKIIYEFHKNNRKILFIGFSKFYSLLKNTQHYYVPEKMWINGSINNRHSILRFLYKKLININTTNNKKYLFLKNFKTLLNITIKPSLIVIFNTNFNNDLKKEFFNLDIPIIQFGVNKYSTKQISYKILGNFHFTKKRYQYQYNIDFLLYSILKKNKKLINVN